MTQQLIECTVRDWVAANARRGAAALNRLAGPSMLQSAQSAEEVADALIRIAGQMDLAETRAW